MPKTSEHKDAAWAFMSWMTSKEYMKLVGEKFGWERLPPGSRLSTYEIPEYREAAKAFAEPTLASLRAVDQRKATVEPVPYIGIQFLGIPEWQDLGTGSRSRSAPPSRGAPRWTRRSTSRRTMPRPSGRPTDDQEVVTWPSQGSRHLPGHTG
jgi:hypothetical protein